VNFPFQYAAFPPASAELRTGKGKGRSQRKNSIYELCTIYINCSLRTTNLGSKGSAGTEKDNFWLRSICASRKSRRFVTRYASISEMRGNARDLIAMGICLWRLFHRVDKIIIKGRARSRKRVLRVALRELYLVRCNSQENVRVCRNRLTQRQKWDERFHARARIIRQDLNLHLNLNEINGECMSRVSI